MIDHVSIAVRDLAACGRFYEAVLAAIGYGKLVVRPTLNPNFRRVDAQVFDEAGHPILTLSTILGR